MSRPALALPACLALVSGAWGACGSAGDDDGHRVPEGDSGMVDGGPDRDAAVDAGTTDAPATIDAAVDAAPPPPPPPQMLTVCTTGGADFATIGAALAAVPAAGKITVTCAGTYRERLVIDRPLELVGTAGAALTILDGGDAGTVITVRAAGGPVRIEGFTITGGRSQVAGGGVRCEDSELALRFSVIDGNTAAGGGGLYAAACALDLVEDRFTHNQGGPRGGGLLLSASTGLLFSSHVIGNHAVEGGGVASLEGEVAIRDSELRENAADLRGGGLYHDSSAAIRTSEIVDNTAGWTGGGLHVVGHVPLVSSNTISGNQSINDGGGVYLHQSGATLVGNTVADNIAGDDGGGIRAFESPCTLRDNVVERNQAGDGGGGIRVSHVPAMLLGNQVRDNLAGGTGGGLDLDNDASTVRGGVISGNRAGGSGGGIFGWLGPWNGLTLADLLIADNHAWQGGGVYLADNFEPVTMRNLRVVGNHAAKGAGLMIRSTTFTLTGSLVADNVATERGGALFAGASLPWEAACPCPPLEPLGQIAFTVMAKNQAPRGAAVWTTFPGLELASSVVYASAGTAIEASTDEPPPVDEQEPPPAMAVPAISYTDIFPPMFAGMTDPSGVDGNLDVDPMFVDPPGGDYHLLPGSPCIDAGAPFLVDVDGSRADMGMFGGAP